jgi:hypothetical protein
LLEKIKRQWGTKAHRWTELSRDSTSKGATSEMFLMAEKVSHKYSNHLLGQGPFSIFEEGEFADESFAMKHSEAGLLGMSKRSGYANTNECQFYVTTGAPLSFLDNKNVVFGRVIAGMRAFKMIDKLEVYNQKPTSIVQIKAAGIYKGM